MKTIATLVITLRAEVEIINSSQEEFGTSIGIIPTFQPRVDFNYTGPEAQRKEVNQMMVDMLREAEWE